MVYNNTDIQSHRVCGLEVWTGLSWVLRKAALKALAKAGFLSAGIPGGRVSFFLS